MKILIPILDFGRGGGYRVLSRLASEWSRDYETSFVVPWFATEPYYPTESTTIHVDQAGRLTARETRHLTGSGRVIRAQIALYRGLQRIAEPGDIVLSNHFLTVLAAGGAERKGATHVRLMQATEADYYPENTMRDRVYRRLARSADARAPHVLVNSPEFLKGDPRRIGVVPPGIDLSVFRPMPRQGARLGPVIGTIGRSEPWKGTSRVLEALRLASLPPGTAIHVANFGADLSSFSDLNISETAPGDDKELARWYQGLDVYVVGASGQEGGYHYPCIEALAVGASLVSPWYRPADDSNAYLCSESSPESLALQVEAALVNPEATATKSRVGRESVRAMDWPTVAEEALEELLACRACSLG